MIVVLKPGASAEVSMEITAAIDRAGLKSLHLPGQERVVIGALGDERKLGALRLENHPMVESVKPILAPFKMVSREFCPDSSVVQIGPAKFGGPHFAVIAGPCAVESMEGFLAAGRKVVGAGAAVIRGGAFKPRTSPYSFQGLGLEGLKILAEVSAALGVPAVTEVVELRDVAVVERYASAFQVGARNMQNFRLLEALGESRKPVILKRGMASTVEDLLLAAEYIVAKGNPHVIVCERGIRTFETGTRNTLDLSAVPLIKKLSHLPVIVDPSHGTGVRHLVEPMTRASVACGADGVIIEVHPDPRNALSDGAQSLFPEQFDALMDGLAPFIAAVGKTLSRPTTSAAGEIR